MVRCPDAVGTISVTAAPVAGRATDHMVRFLAGEFGVAIGDIEVVFGRMNVNKQLRHQIPQTAVGGFWAADIVLTPAGHTA